MNRTNHEERLFYFLSNTIGRHKLLRFTIALNDKEKSATAYEVNITNKTNENRECLVMRCDGKDVELLVGEEFQVITKEGFWQYLFLWNFITLVEHLQQ